MTKIYYHNIQRREFNVTDAGDLIDTYTDGDLIMKSEAGCAILEPLSAIELQELIKDWKEDNHCEMKDCPNCQSEAVGNEYGVNKCFDCNYIWP